MLLSAPCQIKVSIRLVDAMGDFAAELNDQTDPIEGVKSGLDMIQRQLIHRDFALSDGYPASSPLMAS